MAVDDEAGAPVDEHLLDPADLVERAGERVLLRLRVDPPVAGLARSWSGASSPDPVIRLRQADGGRHPVAVIGRPPMFGLASSRRQRDGCPPQRQIGVGERKDEGHGGHAQVHRSAKFGIEAHEAPVDDFPVQPSQKDGLGRMCKTHWNQYTGALRKAALARKAAEAEAHVADAASAEPKSPRAKIKAKEAASTVAEGGAA